jgi:hypothetical protein
LRHAETVQVCGHPPFQRVRACRSPLGCAGRGVYPGQSRAIARRCCGHMVGCRNLPCSCAEICCADWRKGLCRHCRRRRYKPIRDQRIANFITRGAGGSAWDGQSDASTGPLFDIVLRVPQSAGAQVWQRAVGLCPGQHVYAGGVLVAGPWPTLIDVQHLCSSLDALRHAKLLPSRLELLRRAEEERRADAALVRLQCVCCSCCSQA